MEPSKQRPRFSLLRLLLVMALVALALTVAKVTLENQALRRELAGYRAELGVLDDSFPEHFNAVRIETEETPSRREWKWRLRPPAGSNYDLMAADGQIPLTGYLPPSFSMPLEPEMEYLVHVVAVRDEATGLWHVELGWRRDDGRVHQRVWDAKIDGEKAESPGGDDFGVLEGVEYRTQSLPIARRSVVARIRHGHGTRTTAPGIMLWVEPK